MKPRELLNALNIVKEMEGQNLPQFHMKCLLAVAVLEEASVKAISLETMMSQSSASRATTRLEERGLIERTSDPMRLYLTAEGEVLLDAITKDRK